jgi:hypothetical protein
MPPTSAHIACCGLVIVDEEAEAPLTQLVDRRAAPAVRVEAEGGDAQVLSRRRILAGKDPNLVVVGGLLHQLRQLHLWRLAYPTSVIGAGYGSEVGRWASSQFK